METASARTELPPGIVYGKENRGKNHDAGLHEARTIRKDRGSDQR